MRTKVNNLTDLNLAGSWDALPTSMNIANWSAAYTQSGSLLLGANLSWLGIQSTSASAVTIGSGNTLTLGRAGIVMSASGGNVTIGSNLSLLANTNQSWTVGTGRVLTINGTSFTREAGASLNVVVAGTGLVTTTNMVNDATGILGTWATFGTGTATKYAAVSNGNIVGIDGTAAATAAEVSDSTGAVNYNVAAVGTFAAGTSFNTVRYTGAVGTIAGNFQANGLMNAGSGTLTMSGSVTIGDSRELVVNAANASVILSGVVADNAAGASRLTKTGTGTLTLSNRNTYTGVTTISAGSVLISHAEALGSTVGETIVIGQDSAGTGIPAAPGGFLRLSNNINVAERLTLQGLGNNIGTLLTNESGNNTLSGLVTLAGTEGVRVSVNSGSNLTFTGGLSGTGSFFILNPQSNATLAITTTPINMGSGGRFYLDTPGIVALGVSGNTWSSTTISNGTMRMDVAGAIPAAATVVMGAGYAPNGTWNLNGFNQSIATLSSVVNPGARTITSSGTAALTINQTTGASYHGLISGAVSLTKTGAGTLALFNGDNSYGGETVVSSGVLLVHNIVASPIQSGTVAVTNATTATVSMANATGLATGQPITGTGIPAGSFISGISGNTLTITTPTSATAGSITDLAIAGLAGSLRGTTLFYNGQGGTLQFGNSTTSYTLGGLRGSQNLSLLNNASVPAPVALSLGANGESTTYSGVLSGAGASVTKTGTGTLQLQGANTYTGATTVNAGKLLVSGSLSASSAVSVSAGGSPGTLASGNNLTSAVGAVTLASDANGGGILAPGDTGGSGTSTIGRLNVNGTLAMGMLGTEGQARLSIELAGTGTAGTFYDQVVTTGNVSLNNVSLELSLASGFAQTIQINDTFTIILNGGANAVSGTFANAVGGVVSIGAFSFDVNYAANVNGGTNDVVLTVVAVPEPGALGSLLAGAGALVGLRRFRRRGVGIGRVS